MKKIMFFGAPAATQGRQRIATKETTAAKRHGPPLLILAGRIRLVVGLVMVAVPLPPLSQPLEFLCPHVDTL